MKSLFPSPRSPLAAVFALLALVAAIVALAGNPAYDVAVPARSQSVHQAPYEVLDLSKAVTVTTSSQTLAELLSEALDDDAIKVQIVNRHETVAIYLNVGAAATSANAQIAAGEDVVLRNVKADLDALELLSASGSISADVLVWKIKQAQ